MFLDGDKAPRKLLTALLTRVGMCRCYLAALFPNIKHAYNMRGVHDREGSGGGILILPPGTR